MTETRHKFGMIDATMTDSPYPKPKPMAAIQFGPGIVLAGSGWIVYRRDRRRGNEAAGWHAFKPDWHTYVGTKILRVWVEAQVSEQLLKPRPTRHAKRQADVLALLD